MPTGWDGRRRAPGRRSERQPRPVDQVKVGPLHHAGGTANLVADLDAALTTAYSPSGY